MMAPLAVKFAGRGAGSHRRPIAAWKPSDGWVLAEEPIAAPAFPEGHRPNQRHVAACQPDHLPGAWLRNFVGDVGNDVVDPLGYGEQIAHFAKATINEVAAG